jgi:signal transduction histidine kinase
MIENLSEDGEHAGRILVVDDVAQNIELVANFLIPSGYIVSPASGGLEALRTINEDTSLPDLILLDIMMPDLDGMEVCKRLKADARTTRIPVIFLTAKSETGDIIEGFLAGAADYITKPFNREELLARVDVQIRNKRLEERFSELNRTLTESLQMKDRLISIIAHDLKSPLSGVIGLLRLMISDSNSKTLTLKEVDQYIKMMHGTLANTLRLLDNLLEWASIQVGRAEFNPEMLNLHGVIKSTFDLLDGVAKRKNIELLLKGGDDLFALADEKMIVTVIRNLVSNAIKFTNSGGRVVVGCAKRDERIHVVVEDNGIGMTPEEIDRLFAIERKTVSRGTANESGSGLGLFLSKEMVTKNGGEMVIESKSGVGTKITFTLPAGG